MSSHRILWMCVIKIAAALKNIPKPNHPTHFSMFLHIGVCFVIKRVTHICVSKLSTSWSAPSHFLKHCWNIVNWALRNKLQWKFDTKCIHFHSGKYLWNAICAITFICPVLNVLTVCDVIYVASKTSDRIKYLHCHCGLMYISFAFMTICWWAALVLLLVLVVLLLFHMQHFCDQILVWTACWPQFRHVKMLNENVT